MFIAFYGVDGVDARARERKCLPSRGEQQNEEHSDGLLSVASSQHVTDAAHPPDPRAEPSPGGLTQANQKIAAPLARNDHPVKHEVERPS